MALSPRLAVVTTISTGVWLGAAVIGRGGPGDFFASPPLVGLTAVLALLLVASFPTAGHLGAGVREDRSNRWVIWALGAISLADAWLPAWTDRHDFWTFGGDAVRWAGVALFALGGALRLAPVYALGTRFSGLVAIQKGHRLVTRGLYRAIRHPSYLGLLVMLLGWGLAFRAGAGVLLAALALVPIMARIRAEEALLLSEFGAEYEAWRRRTWRLVPGVY